MYAKSILFAAIGGLSWGVASTGWSDVPAPPVNQTIGMTDVLFGELTEADCRACHDSGVPDRHHLLYGTPIPPGSFVPNPDADGDGTPDTVYTCLNCHDESFAPVRDCITCHTSNAHHRTPAAASGDCVSCHGDVVDNIGDGHYIPTYAPSLATPSASGGDGLPLNSRGNGAGACDYCHDDDGLATPIIRTNVALHHAASVAVDGTVQCLVCHAAHGPLTIRVCERCHGPDSLHNIQTDSPNPSNIGTIVVGGEDAGYGHVGSDAGPEDSDCWGCHGFEAATEFAPGTGPTIPTVYSSDVASIRAGADAMVTLTGAALINTMGATMFESDVTMTAADGSSVTLTPDLILDEGSLVVTIPGDAPQGNYRVRAVKDEFESNPTVISIVPKVIVTGASPVRGRTYINGNGFGGFAAGSGTKVTGTYTEIVGRRRRTKVMDATINSWNDSRIVATFPKSPRTVTVTSVWGTAKYLVLPD